jgi:hypothetical protein
VIGMRKVSLHTSHQLTFPRPWQCVQLGSLGYAYPSIDIVVLAGDLLLKSMRMLCSV